MLNARTVLNSPMVLILGWSLRWGCIGYEHLYNMVCLLFQVGLSGHQESDLRCHICGRTCRTKWSLHLYVRSHNGDFRFYCPLCAKGFMMKDDLTTHVNVHENKTPFACQFCGKRFHGKRSCLRHLKIHHANVLTDGSARGILYNQWHSGVVWFTFLSCIFHLFSVCCYVWYCAVYMCVQSSSSTLLTKSAEVTNKRSKDLGALLDSCSWDDNGNFLQTCIKNSLLQTKSNEIWVNSHTVPHYACINFRSYSTS